MTTTTCGKAVINKTATTEAGGNSKRQSKAQAEAEKSPATGWRKNSFFLHLRPKYYRAAAIAPKNTWLLGFFAVFLLTVECLSGLLLMVYYSPTPAGAYQSILLLETEIPFGSLLRDLHRLGGEGLVLVSGLHLLRVLLAGAYRQRFAVWASGLFLLLLVLGLAFSGYLLPWDQLAYWAVTIGTSMLDELPLLGQTIAELLRGGQQFGSDGLLRFYLLHILLLPALLLVLLGVHYFRLVRLGGVLPPQKKGGKNQPSAETESRQLPFLPDVALREALLSLAALLALVIAAAFFYDAPLESQANPWQTPTATRAPWFFLWLQGALKLGDSLVMGLGLPLLLVLFLLFFPCIAEQFRGWQRVALPRLTALLLAAALIFLSILGLPEYGINARPLQALLEESIPQEQRSGLRSFSFAELPQGLYETDAALPEGTPPRLAAWLQDFARRLAAIAEKEQLSQARAVLIVEEWQARLQRIRLVVHWQEEGVPQSIEKELYLADTRPQESGKKSEEKAAQAPQPTAERGKQP